MTAMIDMIGVDEPLSILRKLREQPDVVILHRGRDEEGTKGKTIPYKHINKIRSKYDVMIAAAGGVDLREAESAVFNGAHIVIVNVVAINDPWTGIQENEDIVTVAGKFLAALN